MGDLDDRDDDDIDDADTDSSSATTPALETPQPSADDDDTGASGVEPARNERAHQRADEDPGDEDGDGDEPPARETPAKVETPPVGKPDRGAKRIQTLETRIAALTKTQYTTRAENEALEKKRTQLQAEIDALQGKAPAKAGAKPAGDAKLPKRPRWGGHGGFQDQGKEWDEYEEALDAYDVAVREHFTTTIEEKATAKVKEHATSTDRERAEERAQVELVSRVTAARTAHSDYDAVLKNLAHIQSDEVDDKGKPHGQPFSHFLRDVARLHPLGMETYYQLGQHVDVADAIVEMEEDHQLSGPMMDALLESKNPFAFLQHLADNREEAEEIASLSPAKALLRLGPLVARLDGANSGSPSVARSHSRAAPPPSHRAGRQSAVTTRDTHDIEDPDDYLAARDREEYNKRNRRRAS